MTVHQENTGTASDFGEIGFKEDVQGSFLLFPKSLKRYEGRRVVGVKYDLLKEPPPVAVARPKPAIKPKSQPMPEAKPERKAETKSKPVKQPRARKFEPLRVYEPEQPEDQPTPAKQPRPKGAVDVSQQLKSLSREVRKALKKLEQGNAVAAYQILEKAVSSK